MSWTQPLDTLLGRIETSCLIGSLKQSKEGCESLSYETDQFGIRTLLIEPGCVKTNFVNGIVHAKNASNSNSAYLTLLKKVSIQLLYCHAKCPYSRKGCK